MSEVSMKILVLVFFPFAQATSLEEENDVDEATAEILVVLEKNLSDSFQISIDRHSYFCKLFKDVNDLYKNIDGVKINIALKGLKMSEELEDQPFVEDYIVTSPRATFLNKLCIDAFRNFAMRQEWLKEYDAVILLVNKAMTDAATFSLGNAFTSGFCRNWKNVAIAFPTPLVIAQEIAHLLGVQRDSANCSNASYIMTGITDLHEERDKFSNCFATKLRKQLRKEGGLDCLREENAKDTAKCNQPCDFLSGSECTNYDGIMKTLGLDTD